MMHKKSEKTRYLLTCKWHSTRMCTHAPIGDVSAEFPRKGITRVGPLVHVSALLLAVRERNAVLQERSGEHDRVESACEQYEVRVARLILQ